MARYLNIDKIVPDEQIIEIKGRKFDISQVPSRKTTELIRVGSKSSSPAVANDPSKRYDVYVEEMTALLDVLGEDQNGDPVTFDWVMDNVTNAQFNAIVSFVADCIRGDDNEVAEGETPANFTNRKERRKLARVK